ncbi:MAG: GNAT family N-acetyltransferase [Chloroflexi bacterium]|nr:GNAT family N-acetyltransferase [Chloroflexota bacterium]
MDEYRRVASTSLGRPESRFGDVRPEWTLCGFEDGKLVTTYAAWPLTMRFNGAGVPIAGVTGVGTLPTHRRKGHVRQITRAHFEELYQKGERPIAALHASLAAIYHRYGYAVVSYEHAYSVEPRFLQFVHPVVATGEWRPATGEDFPILVDLYRRFREERTGYVHRGRAMWEAGVLAPAPAGGHLASLLYYQRKDPQGYLVYTVEPETKGFGDWTLHVTVRDLVWLTKEAYGAAWELLRPLDLADRVMWRRVPEDDPLPHLMHEPRMLHVSIRDGVMARVVDVAKALPWRHYGVPASLVFQINDEFCPWNQGRWKLDTSGQETTVRPTNAFAQLTMPVRTLALLVFGQLGASAAARVGALDVLDHDSLDTWDKAMRTKYRPACADLF